mmetsp:Transcript_32717/g.98797  ORF Transcript_32717/g.98797 Transcript_32717/m.98797 type:complete len:513 (-) Transcript_32717:40-1578(-)
MPHALAVSSAGSPEQEPPAAAGVGGSASAPSGGTAPAAAAAGSAPPQPPAPEAGPTADAAAQPAPAPERDWTLTVEVLKECANDLLQIPADVSKITAGMAKALVIVSPGGWPDRNTLIPNKDFFKQFEGTAKPSVAAYRAEVYRRSKGTAKSRNYKATQAFEKLLKMPLLPGDPQPEKVPSKEVPAAAAAAAAPLSRFWVDRDGFRLVNVVSHHEHKFMLQCRGHSKAAEDDFWATAAATFRASALVDSFLLQGLSDIRDVLGTLPDDFESLHGYCKATGVAAETPDNVTLGKRLKLRLGAIKDELRTAELHHRASGEAWGGRVYETPRSVFFKYLHSPVAKYAYKVLVGPILASYLPDEYPPRLVCEPSAREQKRRRIDADAESNDAETGRADDLQRAPLQMRERVAQSTEKLASRKSKDPNSMETDDELHQLKIRMAAAESQMREAEAARAKSEASTAEAAEKSATIALFDAYMVQHEQILEKLKTVTDVGVRKILESRLEKLLTAMGNL